MKTPQPPTSIKPPSASADDIRHAFENGNYPYHDRLSKRDYEQQKAQLQAELLKVQLWAQEVGQKFVVLFEGRDAAGKGGAIKRYMEHLNPRTARIVALAKPTDKERGQWFFSAIWNICRRRAKWFSMIDLGIIAQALNG